jgi:hypothetical protein
LSSAIAEKLVQMVVTCPACNAPLAGHRFAEIATIVCTKDNVAQLTTFFEYVKNRDWTRLREFQGFRGDRDDAVVYAIACSKGGGAIIVWKSVFELYAPNELLLLEPVTQDDINTLTKLVDPASWQTFDA